MNEPMYADSGVYKPIWPPLDHCIVNNKGQFYTGQSGYGKPWSDCFYDRFTMTREAAERKVANGFIVFDDAYVVRCDSIRI